MKIQAILLIILSIPPICFAERKVSARLQDGWIIASQGKDEDFQEVRVKICGSEEITGDFYQLDADPEKEFVVISRGTGTGPYYKLQIIDFLPNGILTWAYDSSGAPYIKNGYIFFGYLPNGYQGSATKAVYKKYKFSTNGLTQEKE
jgi:hypothetical protein